MSDESKGTAAMVGLDMDLLVQYLEWSWGVA